ncbi:helix-turn-helix transcriptional regulator [Actinoallomurus acanthiterrae]
MDPSPRAHPLPTLGGAARDRPDRRSVRPRAEGGTLVPRRRARGRHPHLPRVPDHRPHRHRRVVHPAGFDLSAYWRSHVERFHAGRHRDEATLRVSPGALERIPHVLEPAVARAAHGTAGEPDADGRVRIIVPIESVEQALADFLRLGADIEVLGPPALRERMTETVNALAALYRR